MLTIDTLLFVSRCVAGTARSCLCFLLAYLKALWSGSSNWYMCQVYSFPLDFHCQGYTHEVKQYANLANAIA